MTVKEKQDIEFKQSWRDDYLETICAFANTNGGKLYIGIDDKGKPVGVDKAKKLLEDLPNKMVSLLGIVGEVNLIERSGKDVIEINIPKYQVPISYRGRHYKRVGSTTQELNGTELHRFLLEKGGRGWETIEEDRATLGEINDETIEQFKRLAEKRFPAAVKEKTEVLLDKLHLLSNGKLTRAALLLFGKDPQKFYPGSYVKIGKFLSDTDLQSTDDIRGNLFEQAEKILEVLKGKYLISKVKIEGLYRKEELEYPEEAIREAILNAIIHKDYSGPHSQFKIYPDKLRLWNSGKLTDISVEDLKEDHSSHPRNELIADVFFKGGLIEAWGRGTIKIIDECKAAGLPEPTFSEASGGVQVVFQKSILSEDNLNKEGLNDRQINAINYLKEIGKINNQIYQKINEVSRRTATRELTYLLEKGFIINVGGSTKSAVYMLKT